MRAYAKTAMLHLMGGDLHFGTRKRRIRLVGDTPQTLGQQLQEWPQVPAPAWAPANGQPASPCPRLLRLSALC
jgi:hypothetical protein